MTNFYELTNDLIIACIEGISKPHLSIGICLRAFSKHSHIKKRRVFS